MSEWAAKRFWKSAEVEKQGAGFAVLLDGRAIKTPSKSQLVVPTEALADAIAAEWAAQEEKVDPSTMPVTRAANSAIDKVTPQRREVVDMLAAYGESDLLCYRATGPEALVAQQAAAWDPLLTWAADTLDARLQVGQGVMHVPQPANSLQNLHSEVDRFDAFAIAGFHDLVAISGSLILALAVTKGRLDVAKALVKAGANVNIPDGNGVTPLGLARRAKYAEMVRILEEAGAR